MNSKKLKFIIAFAVIVGGIVLLAASKLKSAFRYSEPLSAVVKAGDSMVGRPLRIQGQLVDKSLVKKRESGKPYFEFQVEDQLHKKSMVRAKAGEYQARPRHRLTVRYDDVLPDTLVKGAMVTAEGKLVRPGYFQATKVFAKCPSKYDSAKAPKGYRPPDPYSAAGRSAPEAPQSPPQASR